MRKQYHFRSGDRGLDAWDVDRLIELAKNQAVEQLPMSEITEIETNYWYAGGSDPTVRSIAEHVQLVLSVDLGYPIVVDPDGRVMDGMHRVVRALLEGHATIAARRLPALPEPDFRDCHPDQLPY